LFAYQDSRGRVDVAFTDRHGGVSEGAFASLNLGRVDGEVAHAVEENLALVTRAFTAAREEPPPVVGMRQVHGADVHVVDHLEAVAGSGRAGPSEPVIADGLATRLAGVALLVRVADCVPVLLADVAHGVVGAAHAGRAGLVAGIVPATVARMRQLGAEDIVAWAGPHVCGSCYEVPEPMRAQVAAAVPESYSETSWGTPALDVGAGVTAQLVREGIEVTEVDRCTLEDDDLFSYRRQGPASGRLGGLVWVRP